MLFFFTNKNSLNKNKETTNKLRHIPSNNTRKEKIYGHKMTTKPLRHATTTLTKTIYQYAPKVNHNQSLKKLRKVQK